MTRLLRCGMLVSFVVLAFVGGAFADDPPSRVARLSYADGSVSFRPGNLDDWAPASRNRPLTTGDRLWTDKGSRSELHLGSTTVRLGPETAFAFLNLDDNVTQMQVTQGSVSVHVRNVLEGESMEVDTPNAAVSLLHPGTYRIDVDANGDSTVSVRRGDAEATAEGSEVPLHARQVGVFLGAHPPIYDIQEESTPDDWDRWCTERERRYEEPHVSARYVSNDVVGSEDLDGYGRWRDVPNYGSVWVPTSMGPSWAPYRAGHWGYVAPWGWTWIDDAPWGFAPFHYGRWARVSGEWVWAPGTIVARPVYAPALVAFVGGNNWSASLSIGVGGGVAWFPLGPREAYYPSYAVSPAYVRNINVTHVNVTNINVTNVNATNVTYVNQSVAGAVTAVPRSTFVSAQPVAAAAVAVPVSAVASVQAGGAPVGVQPTSQSVLSRPVTASAASVPQPPAAVSGRSVVAKMTPPAPAPAFGASAHAAQVVTNPLIRPAIPPPGPSTVAMRPSRATLPPPRPATPPAASFAAGGKVSGAARATSQPTGAAAPLTGPTTAAGGKVSGAPRATSQPTGVAAPLTGPTTGVAGQSTAQPKLNDRPSHAPVAHGAAPQSTGASSPSTGVANPGATGTVHPHTAAKTDANPRGGQAGSGGSPPQHSTVAGSQLAPKGEAGGSSHPHANSATAGNGPGAHPQHAAGAGSQPPKAGDTGGSNHPHANSAIAGSGPGGHPPTAKDGGSDHPAHKNPDAAAGGSHPQHNPANSQPAQHKEGSGGSPHQPSPAGHEKAAPEAHKPPPPAPHPQPTPTPHPQK
ncbi:MAG TPA: DUF6600 domain-containing protein [Vicinamibacteria bacterium]|jgi:hypothetical protein|nr:DUF6600 domain-containing protein [Vicinamibacteria bacterium]